MNKQAMRQEARQRLQQIGVAERSQAAADIARLIWSVPEVAQARVILMYASVPGEVPTDAIAEEAISRGIVLTYPRCLPETRAMVLHRIDGYPELRSGGAFGIREPDLSCPVVEVGEVDAAVVPGLAWDRWGTRLGRGAGYYDRLFKRPGWRGFRCGLFYSLQEFDRLPFNRMDAPLDVVVTERGITRFGEPGQTGSA